MTRFNNLDFIRFLLAFIVLVHHVNGMQDSPLLPNSPFPSVAGFIAISGYLITKSMEGSRGYGHFAWKRFLRVGPAFIVALILSVVLGGNLLTELIWWATLGMVQSGGLYNAPLWTLSVEEVLYALLAIAFAVGIYRKAWVSITLLSAFLLSSFCVELFQLPIYGEAGKKLPFYFAAGSLLYVMRKRVTWRPSLALLSLGAITLKTIVNMYFYTIPVPLFIYALLLSYSLITLGLYAPPVMAWWSKLGDASFGIYVYHYPVLIWLASQGIKDWRLIWILPAIVLPLSFFSWHFLEKQSLRLKDWRLARNCVDSSRNRQEGLYSPIGYRERKNHTR